MRFQSQDIVDYLFKSMKSAVCGQDSISWDTFKYIAADMVPRTLHDKIDLFLEAFTPQDLSAEEKDLYEFT